MNPNSAVIEDVEDDGEPLAAAMTRPFTLGGFTLASLAISLYVPGMAAMICKAWQPVLLVLVLLPACYLACLKDVYFFSVLAAATRLKPHRNSRVWGCASLSSSAASSTCRSRLRALRASRSTSASPPRAS
ncbi:VirB3 family type IV secretion system protein [Azohydromonas lata]|uniref:VirB3 family type IV secretion system protein n=1 Tax=Azohydromonas lata TaxID=45677 RepID=A0ABU5IS85_9BURK|nr:VirB3 family type IV secretion system protein [Azohydromonas lata]MDZ5461762.1 VirB3 family type IV secretion system protein [Azohydromonas lata]